MVRRPRWRERQRSKSFVEQNHKARAARFLVHFFAGVTARLRRENAQSFTFYGGRKQATTKSSVFLNLDIVLRNSTPEGFACIWQKLTKFDKVLKLVGIIETEIERTRIHFLARFRASKRVEILQSTGFSSLCGWVHTSYITSITRTVLFGRRAKTTQLRYIWTRIIYLFIYLFMYLRFQKHLDTCRQGLWLSLTLSAFNTV